MCRFISFNFRIFTDKMEDSNEWPQKFFRVEKIINNLVIQVPLLQHIFQKFNMNQKLQVFLKNNPYFIYKKSKIFVKIW